MKKEDRFTDGFICYRNLFFTTICCFLFMTLPSSSFARWITAAIDTPKYFSSMSQRSIAIDSNNHPHIAYGGDHLYYAHFDGAAWQYEVADHSSNVGHFASIALDSNNKVHISYNDAENQTLKYATNASGSWVSVTVDATHYVGYATSIAVDSNNKVHISYKGNESLKYATNVSGIWVKATIDSNVGNYDTSIAIDSNNKAHISYSSYSSGHYQLKYATNASGIWVTATIDNAGGSNNSIAVDSNNNVHISYYDDTNYALKYATNAADFWEIYTVDSGRKAFTSIALDSNHAVHITYCDDTPNYDLKYATNASGTWTTSVIDSAGVTGWFSSISPDSNNKIHISYYDSTTANLKYATDLSGSWAIQTLDNSNAVGAYNVISIDSNNKIHIGHYNDANGSLLYTTNSSGAWVTETLDNSANGSASAVLDSNDKVHIGYSAGDFNLKYITNASGSWITETVGVVYNPWYISIAIDSSNKAHISYWDFTSRNLQYATNASGEWVVSTLDSSGTIGWYTSIAIDSNNKVHISYNDYTNGFVKYATNASGSWSTSTIDSGVFSSMALDLNNKAHISYYDVAGYVLKYATNASGSWSTSIADSTFGAGYTSSLALDSSNKVHISYSVNSPGYLKYVTNGSGSWVSSVIDSSGNVGYWNSIALDSNNRVHISYHDSSNKDLKYATNAYPIDLPRTGQTKCYNSAGTEIPCAGTGQDGDIQAGVVWPDPRFNDNLDGTITDNLTGLMWLKDANCMVTKYPSFDNDETAGDGMVTWQHCLEFVAGINAEIYSDCGASCSDWRLPNFNELQGLMTNLDAQWQYAWLSSQGFSSLWDLGVYYCSSTTSAGDANAAWCADKNDGMLLEYSKILSYWKVWSVRGTTTIPAELWKTGQTLSYAVGDDGDLEMGVEWPSPRFADNGDGTLIDELTGLMWTKDSNAPGPADCNPGMRKTWQDALNHVACLNAHGYLGYYDWRLPNVNEVRSLVNYGQNNVNWLTNQGFSNVWGYGCWSSTTDVRRPGTAWDVAMYNGRSGLRFKYYDQDSVWPVRGGTITTPIDTTGPSLSITSHSDGQHVTTSSITVIGTASDSERGDNGIQQVTVNGSRADNDTATGSGTANWSKTVNLNVGANTNTVLAYDNSPNHNQTSQTITIYYDVPDTTAPTTTASPAGGTYNSSQLVALTCNDTGGSDCKTTYYCLGSVCNPTTAYSGTINISSSTTLRFYSTDNANNSESVKTETYTINVSPLTVTCSLTPNGAIHLSRGSNLNFLAAAQNDTDQVQVFQFATKVTLPNGNAYPSSGWLVGPITVTLNPHESKSKLLTQFIPYNAPFGTYTYHGYVGTVSPPLLYNQCQFYFTVNP